VTNAVTATQNHRTYWYCVYCADCESSGPLGLITGALEDWQITASSTYPNNWDRGCQERYARVYQPNGVAWCAKHKSSSEWLQVDLGIAAKVCAKPICSAFKQPASFSLPHDRAKCCIRNEKLCFCLHKKIARHSPAERLVPSLELGIIFLSKKINVLTARICFCNCKHLL